MNNVIKIILICLLILTGCTTNNNQPEEKSLYDSEVDKYLLLNDNAAYDSGLIINDQEFRYYPFIYLLDEGHELWNQTLIGNNNCSEGYFYVKDLHTGEIRQLVKEPVFKIYIEDIYDEDTWYYIMLQNKICRINTQGNKIERIVYSNNLNEKAFQYIQGIIYYCDNDAVKRLEVETGKIESLFRQENITRLYHGSNTESLIFEVDDKIFVFHLDSKEIEETDEYNVQGF